MCKSHIYLPSFRGYVNVEYAHMSRVLDALLAPIARLLVARGVLFGEAAERLKQAYVDAAAARAGERATDSRISVMTGLQRRDVVRLRATAMAPAPRPVNHLARLVSVWLTDPRFAGRELPRKGGEDGFEALAQSIRRDVHPRTMLDALLAAGTVVLAGDTVRLVQASFQPLAGSEAQLDYFTVNAGDYLTAATANLLAGSAPFFERAAHFNHLDAEAVAALDRQFRAGQMALLVELGQTAARLQEEQPGPHRFRAGGWFYHEEEAG